MNSLQKFLKHFKKKKTYKGKNNLILLKQKNSYLQQIIWDERILVCATSS